MEFTAPAKLNLFLKVLNKRDDGYHNIDTIFERISIADTISVIPKTDSTVIICDDPSIDVGADSLMGKCVTAFKERAAVRRHFYIEIKKKIPVAAGLGGGSSDAATLLRALNKLTGNAVSSGAVSSICQKLGADIPFFYKNIRFGHGKGRGDKVKKIKTDINLAHILINPGIKVSTHDIYDNYNGCLALTNNVQVDTMFSTFLEECNSARVVENLHNDLQTIVLRDFPVINKAFSILKKAGAHGVLMSGSGPTVFGLFDKQKVGRAFDIVKAEIIPLKNWKTFSADTY